MKTMLIIILGALLWTGAASAQVPADDWQGTLDKVEGLVRSNPAQASEALGALLKGKNKKNIGLLVAVSRMYLDAGKLSDAQEYLAMAKKLDNKASQVSVLEGDIALAQRQVGQACQLYEQAIYFDPNCKEAYLKYAQVYKSASPTLAVEKLNQLKAAVPDCLEADRELAEAYYSNNRFDKAAEVYERFIDTPLATEDVVLKYALSWILISRTPCR